jgi:Bifunctional DNA primase/polymerase, N-terminal/Primase C terminal 1 (PriCT-1)
MNTASHALELAKLWPVFPVWPVIPFKDGWICKCGKCPRDDKNRGKHPLGRCVPHGLTDASANPAIVAHWFVNYPDSNIGVALTPGFIVVDIDPRNGGDKTMASLIASHGKLPGTVVCRTGGGGWHYYFAASNTGYRNTKLDDGIDIKTHGGYVIAPPSNHYSGGSYSWVRGHSPGEVPIAPLPDWMAKKLAKAHPGRKRTREYWQDIAGEDIIDGQRNITITSLAGLLIRKVEPKLAASLIYAYNAQYGKPPLPNDEVNVILNSIAMREIHRKRQSK